MALFRLIQLFTRRTKVSGVFRSISAEAKGRACSRTRCRDNDYARHLTRRLRITRKLHAKKSFEPKLSGVEDSRYFAPFSIEKICLPGVASKKLEAIFVSRRIFQIYSGIANPTKIEKHRSQDASRDSKRSC